MISVGCNTDTDRQIAGAKEWLTAHFPDARYTAVLHSPAWGKPTDAAPYANMLCTATTPLDPTSLLTLLHIGEAALGNTKQRRHDNLVLMDLDLLQYDHEKHHHDDWQRPYTIELLKQLSQ